MIQHRLAVSFQLGSPTWAEETTKDGVTTLTYSFAPKMTVAITPEPPLLDFRVMHKAGLEKQTWSVCHITPLDAAKVIFEKYAEIEVLHVSRDNPMVAEWIEVTRAQVLL